jgi:polyferredoxin
MTFTLATRDTMSLNVLRERNPLFVTLSDGSIRNTYDVRIRNMTHDESDFQITVVSDVPLQVELEGQPGNTVPVPLDTTYLQRVYVTAPPDSAAARGERTDFRFWVEDLSTNTRTYTDTTFFGRDLE